MPIRKLGTKKMANAADKGPITMPGFERAMASATCGPMRGINATQMPARLAIVESNEKLGNLSATVPPMK